MFASTFTKLRILPLPVVVVVTLFFDLSHYVYAGIVVGDAPLESNPQISLGHPTSNSSSSIIISRKQYVISWDYETRTPEWVAWTINKKQLGDVARSNVFRLDHDLDEALIDQNQESVTPNDYKNSCIDRGHQVPSADRTAVDVDNESTFFMSNMVPQSAYLNRRTWVSLERFLRTEVTDLNRKVQVYAGTVQNPKHYGIGPKRDILVPLKNFKIAVLIPVVQGRPRRDQMKFFVVSFPNVTSKGTDPIADHEQACYDSVHTVRLDESNKQPYWRDFLTDLDQVEHESGLDFGFLKGIHEMTPDEVDGLILESFVKDLAPLNFGQAN